jgi:hypothetical protein
VQTAGSLSGSPGRGVPGVMLRNVRVDDVDVGPTRGGWICDNVTGTASRVVPPIGAGCPQLAGGV